MPENTSQREMQKSVDPKSYEAKWYKTWQEKKYFHADPNSPKEKFTILIPPPNVTDRLHMGHGLNNTIQDIMVRYKRMKGFEACWLPGTDHAGIATQMMVEKDLAKSGKTKEEVGRPAFLDMLREWKEKFGGIIIDQLKSLGASADWDREAYTMDPGLSVAVRKIFVELYEKGLIYRGNRLVNWDPVLQTAVSDDEVENEPKQGNFWHFRYPISGTSEHLVLATTRPETMLGDSAVAVHPTDERYKHLVGKTIDLPLCDRKIPIIADEYVDPEFGTGVVKITPAHDFNDFAVGERHGLEMVTVLDKQAKICSPAPQKYIGMDRYEAREQIVRDLKALELVEKIEGHKLTVPISSRSKAVIEPLLSKQWYLKMKELAAPAIKAAKEGELTFHPPLWKKTYLYWLENVQDWCISRQLWWGHQIPIWYCGGCSKEFASLEDPNKCVHCGSAELSQDADVLDTWFSSWLWPISPFGWPEDTDDLKAFFPSNLLVTGADIIYLWVARMIMLGYFAKDILAFKDVYFNSIICDKDGKKFSKTLGNGIDPLEMVELYGADAVRFTCISLAPLGGRVRMSKEDFKNGSKFINKLWNASRFVLNAAGVDFEPLPLDKINLELHEKWLLERVEACTANMTQMLDAYKVNDAIHSIYHCVWDDFCDWGIECAKKDLEGPRSKEALSVLIHALEKLLRLASPFVPFIAEEIWQRIPGVDKTKSKHLMVSDFPTPSDKQNWGASEKWEKIQGAVTALRAVKASRQIPPKEQLEFSAVLDSGLDQNVLRAWAKNLANANCIETVVKENMVASVGNGFKLYCKVPSFDASAEKGKISKEIGRLEKIIGGLNKRLSNEKFVSNADPQVLAETRAQEKNLSGQVGSLQETLQNLV